MGTTISGDTGVVFPDATTQSTAVTVATPFSINASAGAGAQLRLPEATANGVNYVAVKAPDLLAGDVTWTLPAADGTSGQYLQTNGAGQLSFATVPTTSPGGTTGQVQINNAGAFGAISSGTAGQVLTSAGAGVAPSFATPAMSLVSTTTLGTAAASVSFTGLTAYTQYVIEMYDVLPSANTVNFFARISIDGGTTWRTTQYNWATVSAAPGSGAYANQGINDSSFTVAPIVGSGSRTAGRFAIGRNANSTFVSWQIGGNYNDGSGNVGPYTRSGNGNMASVNADALQFYFVGANIQAGATFKLYGIS